MKRLVTICLLCIINISINAQNSGPTKEQTVQFIKDFFSNKINQCTNEVDNGKYTYISRINNISIEFNNASSIMTFYYENQLLLFKDYTEIKKDDIFYEKVIIDFSKIESISLFIGGLKNCKIIYAQLKASPGTTIDTYKAGGYSSKNKEFSSIPSKEKEGLIPINSYECNNCDHNEQNKKIIQAFNHLRKLCGAPEPISFD